MAKKLSEMTLNELWHLFPIILTPQNPKWNEWYDEESRLISPILCGNFDAILHHIGSTAIVGIMAKPIVDIIAEIDAKNDRETVIEAIKNLGYIEMCRDEKRVSFNKGYTENGFAERVFHLHLRYYGDNNELYFRDYLNEHTETAKEYEALKLSLWKQFEFNRDGYTEAKGCFIKEITEKAKRLYGNKY